MIRGDALHENTEGTCVKQLHHAHYNYKYPLSNFIKSEMFISS